jgi:hypothetical protein
VGQGGEFRNIYVKDIATTYSYEILDTATTAQGFLAQMNAQGARGFDFYGPDTAGSVYVKDNTASVTYSFELLPATSTNAAFLSQVNSQGAKGFYYVGPYAFNSTQFYAIYSKISGSAAIYTYALLPGASAGTPDAFLAQANAQGQQGYKFIGENFFGGEPAGSAASTRSLYIKDTSQSSTFTWKTNNTATSSVGFVTQANAEGVNNFMYGSGFAFLPNGPSAIILTDLYFKPASCTGVLCRAASPL